MVNKKRSTAFLALLVVLAMLLSICMTGCNSTKLEKIQLEGYQQDFFMGDEFTTGPDFKVYAVYSDGSRVEVQDYTIRQESGLDMNVVGDYMITVEYQGKKEAYTIYVNDDTSVLSQLTVDSTGVRTSFMLGEAFDFEGIRVTATYKNASGRDISIVYGDLKSFRVTVADAAGNTYDSNFEEFGTHTITIAKENVSASYQVVVEGVDLESVGSAIYVAKYGAQFVDNGSIEWTDKAVNGNATTYYEYAFGDNYTYIKETYDSSVNGYTVTENFYSLDVDTGKLINTTTVNGELIAGTAAVGRAMNGVPIYLWYMSNTEYGIEAAIENLYKIGATNPNQDYTPTVDLENRTYSFAYTYVLNRITGVSGDPYTAGMSIINGILYFDDGTIGGDSSVGPDRYVAMLERQGGGIALVGTWTGIHKDNGKEITIVIEEDGSLTYTCGNTEYLELTWEEADSFGSSQLYTFEYGTDSDAYFFINRVSFTLGEDYAIASATLTQTLYTEHFTTDENGYTSLDAGATYAHQMSISVTQQTGERNAENPYSQDKMYVEDIVLTCDGKVLEDGDVISDNAGTDISIVIDALVPESASLTVDSMYLSDGSSSGSATIFICGGFTAYRRDNVINVRLAGDGEWTLVISTRYVTRTITLKIQGVNPTSLTSQVYRPAYNSFAESDITTAMVGKTVYFRAEANQYANGKYTAQLSSGDSSAQLVETEINGVSCWALTATTAGEYTVKMISTADTDVTCELTITVVEMPDLTEMLDGGYTATDSYGGVYDLEFTPTGSTATTISGTVTVTYTEGQETKTQILRFTTSESDLALTLETVSGENLGIDIMVNTNGQLVLEDMYSNSYVLTAK